MARSGAWTLLLTISNILILSTIGATPLLEDAFEVLAKDRGISSEKWLDACETIDDACPVGDDVCIRRLMAIWETPNYRGRVRGPLEMACEKTNDATLHIILESVQRKLEQAVRDGTPGSANALLGEAGIKMSARLKDPEPLIRFVFDAGEGWGSYHCSPEVKERYVFESIRLAVNDSESGPGSGSGWAGYLSDEAIPALRTLMREMFQENPHCQGVWGAIPALVQLDDTEIIPDLEAILASPRVDWPSWARYESNVRKYLAKLKIQHDREKLLRIVETERDRSSVLTWAVWRALWLKVDRETIHDLLSKNRRLATVGLSKGRDIAESLTYSLFGEGPDYYIHPKHGRIQREVARILHVNDYRTEPLILDRDEFRQSVRENDASRADSIKRREEEQAETYRIQRESKTWTEEQKAEYKKRRKEESQKRVEKGWLNLDERIRKYTLRAIFEAAPATKQDSDRVGSARSGNE